MQTCSDSDCTHVVIGIIKNTKNEVLLSKRCNDVHLGGLLEFPGGKVEADESPYLALSRELKEELNINVLDATNLIQFTHEYPDRKVFLDVYSVNNYSGTVAANESQKLEWQNISSLEINAFPHANHGIIRALQLPKLIAVTPNFNQYPDNFLKCFEKVIKNKECEIIHLRSHDIDDTQFLQLTNECLSLCKKYDIQLVLNRSIKFIKQFSAIGLHLTSKRLLATKQRPLEVDRRVSASCHNSEEVLHATKIGLDYIFLGPVVEKHISTSNYVLGWEKFTTLAQQSEIPVYAIGGLSVKDVDTAQKFGGQGIAAIRDLWIAN